MGAVFREDGGEGEEEGWEGSGEMHGWKGLEGKNYEVQLLVVEVRRKLLLLVLIYNTATHYDEGRSSIRWSSKSSHLVVTHQARKLGKVSLVDS